MSAREEIRFAVVLNGGVSLAVWMGGVAHEIDELTWGRGCYGRLLGQLKVKARADVIAGTSAGGINGAALAISQASQGGADLSELREVWLEQGRMETLLQRPFVGEPASLLRGETYFLPGLTDAMGRLYAGTVRSSADERPVDLTITTTLLDGYVEKFTDGLGQLVSQRRFDGRFEFRRGPSATAPGVARRDDFAESDVVERLALAARASAGFPLAFEPTFIPVDAGPDAPADRPDMGTHATWRADEEKGARADRSRFAVDGGVLANTPTRHALDAIQRMPAGRNVERMLLLVVPRSGFEKDPKAAEPQDAPSLATTGMRLLGALTAQGSRGHIEEVERHNRLADTARLAREDVVALADRLGRDSFSVAAERAYPFFRVFRLRRAARELARLAPRVAGWTEQRTLRMVSGVQDELRGEADDDLPYSPARLEQGFARDRWPWGWGAALDVADAALEYLDLVAHDLELRDASAGPARVRVERARQVIHHGAAEIRRIRDCFDETWWSVPQLRSRAPDAAYWRNRLRAYQWLFERSPEQGDVPASYAWSDEVRDVVLQIGRLVTGGEEADLPSLAGVAGTRMRAAVDRIAIAVGWVAAGVGSTVEAGSSAQWSRLFAPGTDRGGVLEQLLRLHVLSSTFADELPTENTRPARMVLVSASTQNHFAKRRTGYEDKLGGETLARFSGFLKASWRQNDWMWGRCDAATQLFAALLTPRRVSARVRTVAPAAAVEGLFREVAGTGIPPRLSALAESAGRGLAELIAVGDDELDDRVDLVQPLARLLAYARHAEIATAELPRLADSIRADLEDGAPPGTRGARFLQRHRRLLEDLEPDLPAAAPTDLGVADTMRRALGGAVQGFRSAFAPDVTSAAPPAVVDLERGLDALDAFDDAGIGTESVGEEIVGDQLMRTAVTGVGIAATVLDGPHSGVPAVLKPLTRTVRGVMHVPYWVTEGLTRGGSRAKVLATLAMAVGGVLLALALLGLLDDRVRDFALLVGGGALLLSLAYASLRAGSHVHGAFLLLITGFLAVSALLLRGVDDDTAPVEGAGFTALVAGLVLVAAFMLVGTIPQPVQPPWAYLWRGRWTVAVVVVLGAVAWALATFGDWRSAVRWVGTAHPTPERWAAGAAAAILALVLLWYGLRLRGGTPGRVARAWVTTAWCGVYGAVSLAAAWYVRRQWEIGAEVGWRDVSLALLVVAFTLAGVLLVTVAVAAVWRRAYSRSLREVQAAARRAWGRRADGDEPGEEWLEGWLRRSGRQYAFLVRASEESSPASEESSPLRPRGKRLLKDLERGSGAR